MTWTFNSMYVKVGKMSNLLERNAKYTTGYMGLGFRRKI